MKTWLIILAIVVVSVFIAGSYFIYKSKTTSKVSLPITSSSPQSALNPMSIEALRARSYPGSVVTIEKTLPAGVNYQSYIASYLSDGLKIYALLDIPNGQKPAGGWPVIVFDHGYIPPKQYITTERYVAYADSLARAGYIVFKPDYRGNGQSEGTPSGAYFSPGYTIDVLNAVASMKKYAEADPSKIGMWGHSMGGQLTLRSMVVSSDIKVGVIWGGVVAPYDYLFSHWRTERSWNNLPYENPTDRPSEQNFKKILGSPAAQAALYKAISPNSYLSEISGPIQLHHGLADTEVPPIFSQMLNDEMKAAGKTVELYEYLGEEHNINGLDFNLAMTRTIAFFDKYLK